MNGEKRGRRWRGREPIGDERASSPLQPFCLSLSFTLPSTVGLDLASSPFRTTSLHPRKTTTVGTATVVYRLPTSVTYLPQTGASLAIQGCAHARPATFPLLLSSGRIRNVSRFLVSENLTLVCRFFQPSAPSVDRPIARSRRLQHHFCAGN